MSDLERIYSTRRPVGVYGLCNWGGLVVYDIAPEDLTHGGADFVTGFDFGNGLKSLRHSRVHYTMSGRAYITKKGVRYYLDEIMRTF